MRISRILSEAMVEAGNTISSAEEILFDYSKGRAFAIDVLQKRIPNLSQYQFAEYFPITQNHERFEFEQILMNGEAYQVAIEHGVDDTGSLWKLFFGAKEETEEQGEQPKYFDAPQKEKSRQVGIRNVIFKTKWTRGFDAFVGLVNSQAEEWDFDKWEQDSSTPQ